MKRSILVPSLIVLGFGLVLLGLAWKHLVPSSAYWSPEQAQEYSAAQADMHTKSHQHGADAERDMDAARERFKNISRQLDRARGSQSRAGMVFVVAGIALVLAGIAVHVSSDRSE
jgi:hypothetical protein